MQKRLRFYSRHSGSFSWCRTGSFLWKVTGKLRATRGLVATSLCNPGRVMCRFRIFVTKVTIIYFGYTNCPDACPIGLGKISAALQKMQPEQSATNSGIAH